MPVLPEVGSRIVWPGSISPSASADSIIALATRSLTEPVGLRPSSLAKIFTSGLGESRESWTIGVPPIDSTMSPKRPPQGRLSRPSSITSKSIARSAAGHGREDHHGVAVGDRGVEAVQHPHVLVVEVDVDVAVEVAVGAEELALG